MSNIRKIILLLCLLLAASSCDSIKGNDAKNTEPARPIALTKAQKEIISWSNAFAFNIFRELANTEAGVPDIMSPLSLSTALAMTSCGAAGNTLEQMKSVLGYGEISKQEMNEAFQDLLSALKNVDPGTKYSLANSIWINDGFEVRQSFLNDCATWYFAGAQELPFNKESSLKLINDWCFKVTEGRVADIVTDSDLVAADVAILNGIYFNSKWRFSFSDEEDMIFRGLNGGSTASFMCVTDNFSYGESENWQILELPYGNGAFVMTILLPSEDVDFNEFLQSVDYEEWNRMVSSMCYDRVVVNIPAFKVSSTIDAVPALKSLGMADAFLPIADFSAMAEKQLAIKVVRQKAYIDVNIKGTEAAAVSVVIAGDTSVPEPAGPKTFIADHPFIYTIRESSTGCVLFLGKKVK